VTEFSESKDDSSRQEIAANLTNFAYSHVNHEHFAKLNILDLFLDLLDEDSMLLRR